MKRKKVSMLGAGFAMALAGLTGTVQATQPVNPPNQETRLNEIKATVPKTTDREARKVHSVGGLDLMQLGEYGMSPKEYGIRFGSGNKSNRPNRLRFSHNAKLKRR